MSDLIKNVDEASFETEVLKSEIPVLVDFWAEWCSPCRALGKTLEQIATEREGKIKICKVSVEDAPSLAAQFNIRNIPFVAFFKNGLKVSEMVGNQAKQVILNTIDSL